jgi:hypothetical protein
MHADGVNIDITKLENLKLELKNYELEKCKGAVLRSKAIWATEGDKKKNCEIFLILYFRLSHHTRGSVVYNLHSTASDIISLTLFTYSSFDKREKKL